MCVWTLFLSLSTRIIFTEECLVHNACLFDLSTRRFICMNNDKNSISLFRTSTQCSFIYANGFLVNSTNERVSHVVTFKRFNSEQYFNSKHSLWLDSYCGYSIRFAAHSLFGFCRTLSWSSQTPAKKRGVQLFIYNETTHNIRITHSITDMNIQATFNCHAGTSFTVHSTPQRHIAFQTVNDNWFTE